MHGSEISVINNIYCSRKVEECYFVEAADNFIDPYENN